MICLNRRTRRKAQRWASVNVENRLQTFCWTRLQTPGSSLIELKLRPPMMHTLTASRLDIFGTIFYFVFFTNAISCPSLNVILSTVNNIKCFSGYVFGWQAKGSANSQDEASGKPTGKDFGRSGSRRWFLPSPSGLVLQQPSGTSLVIKLESWTRIDLA